MTEFDPNETPVEPDVEDPGDDVDRPLDAANTPDEAVGPQPDGAPIEPEKVPDEESVELAGRALTVNDEATGEPEAAAPSSIGPSEERSSAAVSDETSDVASIPDESADDPKLPSSQLRAGDWQAEMSAHRIAVELKHVETRIRELLSDRDSRRKRKLAGTYRWHELEEDIIAWRAERRFDSDTLEELHRLTCRRHYLFNQLRFAASTRPTWNS